MRVLIDPTDAIFEGMSSSLARAVMALAAFVLGYLCHVVPSGVTDGTVLLVMPLVAFGMVFAWGTKGVLFFVGLAALIAFFVAAWRFLDTTMPKACFLLMFVAAFVYFIPLTGSEELPVWKAFAAGGVFVAGYVGVAYLLPWAVELFIETKKRKEEEAGGV